ncbi:MAG: phosphotransferase [Gemmobacter sp.]|nr:phosphotransferase [Gemmobacter sp.]
MTQDAVEAAPRWRLSNLHLIVDRENAVYAATRPAGRAALRLHRVGYQSQSAIQSELWWCAALAEAGAPVPRAIPATDGALLHRLSSGRLVSVIDWVDGPAMGAAGVPLPGTPPSQASLHRAVGAMVARVHDASDSLVLPAEFSRPAWDVDGLTGEVPFWGRFWDHPDLTPPERALLSDTRVWLSKSLTDYQAAGGDFGLILADVLRENVLIGPEGPVLIDFDDAGWGFRLYDLGTVLSQCLSEPCLPLIAQALVAGYAEVRPLTAADRAMVPVFTLARCCASVGWTMPRLSPDDPIRRRHIDRATRIARQVLSGNVGWWSP